MDCSNLLFLNAFDSPIKADLNFKEESNHKHYVYVQQILETSEQILSFWWINFMNKGTTSPIVLESLFNALKI